MKRRIILLLIISIFIFTSCKTGTLVIVPIPNIEIPIYPPQTNLSLNTNIFNNYYLGLGGFSSFNRSLFNNSTVFFNGTTNNNLFKKNFVYLK
ncbi:hypothetical protein [uncultured Brachyspira sp.]|uniref:hypothetical protein n=1 Tax=uncultured Brachyspira sp. TaxID=221953 RepID=UPI002622828E|nr:hypothetical protein [uncultured Brachyspira sp.]